MTETDREILRFLLFEKSGSLSDCDLKLMSINLKNLTTFSFAVCLPVQAALRAIYQPTLQREQPLSVCESAAGPV